MTQKRAQVKLADGRIVCFMTGIPVAAYIPADFETLAVGPRLIKRVRGKWIATKAIYNPEITAQMNVWANPTTRITVDDKSFRTLILPLIKAI